MKRTILLTIMALVVGLNAPCHAQRGTDGEPHRTRLIPYLTADAAAEGSLERQRYMQPIEEWQNDGCGTLRGEFTFPFSWLERQVFLRVEDAGAPYEVVVNGRVAGSSTNGFAPAEYNITRLSVEDRNSVELRLLSRDGVAPIECFDATALVSQPKVYIISQPRVRVRDIFYRPSIGMGGVVNGDYGVIVHNETLGEKSARIYYDIYLNDTIRLSQGYRDVTLGMYGVDTLRFGAPLPDSVLWSAASPSLLSLRVKTRMAGRDLEFYDVAVGMREVRYEDGTFYINGEAADVVWHEMSPASTIADVASAYDSGIRAVRFTAGCVSNEVLDYCDSVGLYVAVTSPINSSLSGSSRRRGGNPSNNLAWRSEYISRVEQMAHTTKRHPSVIAYFLADDSANGICLYDAYIALKRIITDRPVFYPDGGNEWNSDR